MSVCPNVLELRFYGCFHPYFSKINYTFYVSLVIKILCLLRKLKMNRTIIRSYKGHEFRINQVFIVCHSAFLYLFTYRILSYRWENKAFQWLLAPVI